jgi:Flp pilus assembly protein TadG
VEDDPKRDASGRPRNERGVVFLWVALFLTLILGFVALTIDIAKLMTARSQLQNAADAAALAGASAIDPATGAIVGATAIQRVQQTAALNRAFVDIPEAVVVDAADVVTTATTCQVTVRREGANSVVTYVAKVLGIYSLDMTATATAKVDTVSSVLCNVVPLAAAPLTSPTFEIGQVYVLKLPGGSGMTGQYLALDLTVCKAQTPECAGETETSKIYSCLLAHGSCCAMSVAQVLDTKPGNMSGPTRDGILYRFNNDTVRTQNITYSQYLSLGGNGSRVVVVPITTNAPVGGNAKVTIKEFGTFFLRNIPGNGNDSEVDGEFIYATIAGVGGGSGPGAVAFAARLIN